MSSLDKCIFSYKRLNERELTNENIEVILNTFEMNKFELNLSVFNSGL